MGKEEILCVKEDNAIPDCSLFLLWPTLAVTLAVDTSKVLYLCRVTHALILLRAPKVRWRTVGGKDPAPTCM